MATPPTSSGHDGKGLPRLKKRAEFLRVASGNRKAVTPGLILQERLRPDETDAAPIRVGFTVSRKVGNAVARNRARRRLRAAVAEVLPLHAKGGRDFVLIGRGGTIDRPFAALVADLKKALRRLDAWKNGAEERGDTGERGAT